MSLYTLLIAYLMSILFGQIFMWGMMRAAHKALGNPVAGFWWVSLLTGLTERGITTTLIIWAPGFAALFIGGWTVAKFAAAWNRVEDVTPNVRAARMMALVGTAFSFGIAVAAGLWAHPGSLAMLAKPPTSS